jgi:hypothetical protein
MVDWRLSTGVLGQGREEGKRKEEKEREGDLIKECGG